MDLEIGPEESKPTSWVYGRPRSPWIRVGQWIVIPIVLFLLSERAVKPWIVQREGGYFSVTSRPPEGHVDALFIGSSQIEAAIDPPAFDAQVAAATGKPFQSLKFGIGGIRSLAVHFMGLRNLFRRYPDKFRGCTVFLEAPYEHPSATTWADPWYFPGAEKVVLANVQPEDMPRLLASDPGAMRHMEIQALLWQRHVRMSYYRVLLRYRIMDKVETTTAKVATKLHLLKPEIKAQGLDLAEGGILRTDAIAVAIGYKSASNYGDEIKNLRHVYDWNDTIVGDIRKLVVANGGQLVLFQMPKHTIFIAPFSLPKEQQDIQSLKVSLAKWHVDMLHPHFTYDDSDFQDYWHLRHSRSAEFTRDLADAWLNTRRRSP